MKNRMKIILGVLIFVAVTVIIVVGTFHLMEREDSATVLNANEDISLTEEQYQLLVDSILPGSLGQMNDIELQNAWLILNLMAEIEFVENRYPGESGVSLATWILDMLDVGRIKEVTISDVLQEDLEFANVLVMRLVNEDNRIYYARYNQTWGLTMVRKDSEDGEIIYGINHAVIEGKLCLLEYPRGPIISCSE